MNKIELPESLKEVAAKAEPKYRIYNDNIFIRIGEDKYKSLGIHNINEQGILCNDLETFITWDEFEGK